MAISGVLVRCSSASSKTFTLAVVVHRLRESGTYETKQKLVAARHCQPSRIPFMSPYMTLNPDGSCVDVTSRTELVAHIGLESVAAACSNCS